MPFDLSNKACHEHSLIPNLVQQADEALEACERDLCVDLIEQIYELLDLATAARVVMPAETHNRSFPCAESGAKESPEQLRRRYDTQFLDLYCIN